MSDASRTCWITFNGEIYNYIALRDELTAGGARFQTGTDTEVILEAYRAWGDECVTRLEGMFAFAIFDTVRQRVLLARDRVGEKPLFYIVSNGALRFASEIKALLQDPSVMRCLDPEAFDEYLTYGYVTAPRCILRGIRKLQPGHALSFHLNDASSTDWCWWTWPDYRGGLESAAESEVVGELESLLGASVRRQLVADVNVGVLLSGGLDSSLIAALAAQHGSKPIQTFTVTFPDAGQFDEAVHARLVASHLGARHTELQAASAGPESLNALARQFDEPLGDSSLLPTYLVSSLIRQSATVAVGGDGGDELFGGYPMYSRYLAQERLRRAVPKTARQLVARASGRLPMGMRGRNDLLGFGGDVADRMAQARVLFDQATRARLIAPLRARIGNDSTVPERRRRALGGEGDSAIRTMTAMDARSYLPDDILNKVDRASMLASLEVRAPFLDVHVIDFAFSRLPDKWRATAHGRKMILRALARRLLPAEMDVTRKQGFSVPLADWLRGTWGDTVREVLVASDPSLFNHAVISELLRGIEKGREVASPVFALVMFELWRREYGIGVP